MRERRGRGKGRRDTEISLKPFCADSASSGRVVQEEFFHV